MTDEKRPVIITGNWKMYKTADETANFIKELASTIPKTKTLVYLAVPFTAIESAAKHAKGTKIVVGAQNMHDASEGAFTGEISAKMLVENGAKFVILGHSERRRYFKESNEFINRKLKRAIEEKLQPVLCIGETLEEREAGKTQEVLFKQLKECLDGLQSKKLKNLILAYEPVWAIGTDKTATPDEAEAVHLMCRKWFTETFDEDFASTLVIQYGGSVKPDNAKELLEQPDIDGLLVGGASLSVNTFSEIVNSINRGE